LLASAIIWVTLQRPVRHIVFLAVVMVVVTACGWGLGVAIRGVLPFEGLARFSAECALWLLVVALVASPLLNAALRAKLAELVPS
jgi:hypothetical protein